ncbi:Chromatin-remodeling ATPase INO80 [Frankliniella fusca]|uniref:Chromatin-remodeling ATPase INO80 n=1 Tax=Frankliniella fusca TaxID=407009 RepID=A0AAE1LK79_9NEOP|nr:Chromatin-remodeling ATPase INO80 [Frankliniella fusca]
MEATRKRVCVHIHSGRTRPFTKEIRHSEMVGTGRVASAAVGPPALKAGQGVWISRRTCLPGRTRPFTKTSLNWSGSTCKASSKVYKSKHNPVLTCPTTLLIISVYALRQGRTKELLIMCVVAGNSVHIYSVQGINPVNNALGFLNTKQERSHLTSGMWLNSWDSGGKRSNNFWRQQD